MTEPEDLNFTAFTDLCRLCSLKSGPRLHIFDKESEQRQILFKLRTCLPTMISKDDFLPKKICERCVTRLEQLYEWRQSCLSTDSVLRNYAESMKIVTSTINFQYGFESRQWKSTYFYIGDPDVIRRNRRSGGTGIVKLLHVEKLFTCIGVGTSD
ncbi:hypothetical protein B5X24_HaOG205292 [Helicoverpa armigera]|uniref:ZAD domain-containing protein n=1 Tax=Helicoverpa armigera TaxID=29058 RepID=A0A2W1BNU4_HELAM|nr:hypothetical protein B5X24_HaOG205292 [Helicoverpa armigera]